MGYYEPQWSAEEQTMIDLMQIAGYFIKPDINREYTDIYMYKDGVLTQRFRDDTEYGAIRKAFNSWSEHNA